MRGHPKVVTSAERRSSILALRPAGTGIYPTPVFETRHNIAGLLARDGCAHLVATAVGEFVRTLGVRIVAVTVARSVVPLAVIARRSLQVVNAVHRLVF